MNQFFTQNQPARQGQVPFQLGPKGTASFQYPIQSLPSGYPLKSAFESLDVDMDSPLTHLFDFREAFHTGGPQLGPHPYLTSTHPIPFARNDMPALDNSPLSDYNDTPQTLYRSSPMTEYADEDLAVPSDDDEESEESAFRRRSHDARDIVVSAASPSQLVLPVISSPTAGTSPTTYTLGDLGRSAQAVNEVQERSFKQRLQNDIKTTALFPASSPSPPRAPIAMPQVRVDVTPVPTAPINVPARKPSIHLVQPAEPINPYQRIVRPAIPAFIPFQAPVISDAHLLRTHREKEPQPTVSLKDLMVADAQFWGGYDPEVMAASLSSPIGITVPLEMDTEYGEAVHVIESPRGRSQRATSVTVKAERISSITTRSGLKRRAPSPHESDEEDSDDDEEDAERQSD